MIKTGRVEEGHTPSVVSGGKSDFVKSGEALSDGEDCPNMPEIPLDSDVGTVQSDSNESDDPLADV